MTNFLNLIRTIDFKAYYYIYQRGLNSDWYQYFFYFFARYGILIFFLAFIYLIWKKKIKAFLCILFAMGLAGLCDLFVYVFWARQLPYITYSKLISARIEGMYVNSSSFPSSHTYIAFAVATSVFLYGHKRLGAFLFLMAILVGVGRIGEGLHYPSDILGGAIIGIFTGWLTYYLFKNWEKKQSVNS